MWGLDLSGPSGGQQGAGGVGGLLLILKPTGVGTACESYAPAYDGNGNVMTLVRIDDGNSTAGELAGRYTYDPYGNELYVQAGGDIAQGVTFALSNPFRYSTKYKDSETNLLYFGYRYYNAQTGKWLNRDPIEEEGGVNVYGYVGNEPIQKVDPFGKISYDIDDTACEVKMTVTVQINFVERLESAGTMFKGIPWSTSQKTRFSSSFESALESTWSSSGHGYKIYPKVSRKFIPGNILGLWGNSKDVCCPCVNKGYDIKLDIKHAGVNATFWGWEDWDVSAINSPSHPKESWRAWNYRGYTGVSDSDLVPALKAGGAPGARQRSAVHEFGHFLGLSHPGENIGKIGSGTIAEYTHVGLDQFGNSVMGPSDLMGSGGNFRPFYFDKWLQPVKEKHSDCEWSVK